MDITCPITLQIFSSPVLASDGFFYEKQALTRWISTNKYSPFTKQLLNDQFYKSTCLKHYIDEFLLNNPNKKEIQYSASYDHICCYQIVTSIINDKKFTELLKYKNFKLDKLAKKFYSCKDADVIDYVLSNRVDEDITGSIGYTALKYACQYKNIYIVSKLIDMNVMVKLLTDAGNSLIHVACKTHNYNTNKNKNIVHIVKMLVDKGIDVNIKNHSKERPIHLACLLGRIELVQLLIDYGANLESESNDFRKPIHYACSSLYDNSSDVVQLLIDHNVDLECRAHNEETPIHFACKSNNIETVKLLMNAGVNLESKDADQKKPIHYACKFANKEMVKLLIEANVDLNSKNSNGNTPLHTAVDRIFESIKIIKLLVDQNVDINCLNNYNQTPLDIIFMENTIVEKSNPVVMLIKHGALFNAIIDDTICSHKSSSKYFFNHMLNFCKNNKITVEDVDILLKTLIATGRYNLELQYENGSTLISFACQTGNLDVVKYLVNDGVKITNGDSESIIKANIYHINNFGCNSLYWALYGNTMDVITYLLDNYDELLKIYKNDHHKNDHTIITPDTIFLPHHYKKESKMSIKKLLRKNKQLTSEEKEGLATILVDKLNSYSLIEIA